MSPNPKLRQLPATALEAGRASESGAFLTSAPQRAIKRVLRAVWRVCFENHGLKKPLFDSGGFPTPKTAARQGQPLTMNFRHV